MEVRKNLALSLKMSSCSTQAVLESRRENKTSTSMCPEVLSLSGRNSPPCPVNVTVGFSSGLPWSRTNLPLHIALVPVTPEPSLWSAIQTLTLCSVKGHTPGQKEEKKSPNWQEWKNPIMEMKEAGQAYVSRLWIIRPASSHYFLASLTVSQEGALAVYGLLEKHHACLTHLSPC